MAGRLLTARFYATNIPTMMFDEGTPGSDGSPRWRDYVLAYEQDASALLRAAAEAEGRLVLVIGDGFDPRALHSLECLLKVDAAPEILRIGLPRGAGEGPSHELAEHNRARVRELADAHALTVSEFDYPEDVDPLAVGTYVSRGLVETGRLRADDVVVIDISALPTRLYFPLIGTLLALRSRYPDAGELLVTVSENPELDERIESEGADNPGAIIGFSHGVTAEAGPERVQVWAPVLGEGQGAQLESIFDFLQPQEICPVLPFPARDPRRADDLVLEHRLLLFDRFEVVPRNILYVDEANPFDTYRALSGLHRRYQQTLAPLGNPQLITSAHSSKMLSIGVCLAAWENHLPVVTAGPSHYRLNEIPDPRWVERTSRLACLWLDGSPYR